MELQAVIYSRISRDAEGQELGVTRQEDDCRALAQRLGYRVVHVYRENDTGASKHSKKARPQYRAMLDAAARGEFAAILAYSNSRLTRRPAEWEELIRLAEPPTSLRVHTVASPDAQFTTADGRGVLRTIAAWDAAEAERTAERVARAKKQSAAEGRWRGGPRPFGFQGDGITHDPVEAEAIRYACAEILAGRSVRGIARDLQEQGIVSTGKQIPMSQSQLRTILLRARNAGLIESKGEIVGPAVWEPIVEEDTWRAVRAILEDPSRRTNDTDSTLRWIGSHLYECGVCGAKMRPSANGGRRAYRCNEGSHVSRGVEQLDSYVRAIIAARLSQPDVADLIDEPAEDKAARAKLRTDLLEARTRRDQLGADYAAGLLTAGQVHEATKVLDLRVSTLEQEMERASVGTALKEVACAADPAEYFLHTTVDRQRAIVDALVKVTVLVAPRGRTKGFVPGSGTGYFNPEYIRIDWKKAA